MFASLASWDMMLSKSNVTTSSSTSHLLFPCLNHREGQEMNNGIFSLRPSKKIFRCMMQTANSGIFWTEYLGFGDTASQNLKALDCIDIQHPKASSSSIFLDSET